MTTHDKTDIGVNKVDNCLARPGQSLIQHSIQVSSLAARFGERFGIAEMLRVAGFLHDLGKISPEFQAYLFDEESKRGSVWHSALGGKRAYADIFETSPHVAEILSNIITAHHTRLYDYISPDGSTPLQERLNDTTLLPDPVSMKFSAKVLKEEFDTLLDKMNGEDKAFGLSMLIKLAYSCLVDADRLDAYLYENRLDFQPQSPDWKTLKEALMHHLEAYNAKSEMEIFRRYVSERCAEAGKWKRGIYKLEVPTGGGKTLSSLRFALEHAQHHKMERIIYVIPYLSILSQTAEAIRNALGVDENIVLEHHSGFLPDAPEYYKLHIDRWDSPIILTTQVQFLESLFSASGSDLRKLHHIGNSVIILDEVQSLPVKCVHLFNSALNFLYMVCGSTALLCSATQPLLDTVPRKLIVSENPSIVHCQPISERTCIQNAIKPGGYTYPELASFVKDKHSGATLVIVNTKAAAKSLYKEFKQEPVLHLSTNMCAAHRDAVIKELRRRLDMNVPVLCISTQLIEAGVNISFECVIRAVSGLDSIYQAAGRCNRHGEYGVVKDVFVVNIAEENLDRLPDIKTGAEITMRLFDEGNADINKYYKYYFHARHEIMDYPVEGGSLHDWLSVNAQGKRAYKGTQRVKPPMLWPAIRSAADAFYVIDRGREDIVVPYGNSIKLVSRYSNTINDSEKRKLLRELGKYSVSLYAYQLEALKLNGALNTQESMTLLDEGFYDAEIGLDMEGHPAFLCL